METNPNNEDKRAFRIAFRIREYHTLLANVYENLVDRDFVSVEKDVKLLLTELRYILSEIKDDDF